MAMKETDPRVRAELLAAAKECEWMAREALSGDRSRGRSSYTRQPREATALRNSADVTRPKAGRYLVSRMAETEASGLARSLIADFGTGALPMVERAGNKLRTQGMTETLKFWNEVAAAIRAIQAGSES
jgi:hypothetical protein